MSVATVPRSERIAPDVTAIHGAEAVATVRAGGFIAAIESVASELPGAATPHDRLSLRLSRKQIQLYPCGGMRSS